jgi:hypothetical protein
MMEKYDFPPETGARQGCQSLSSLSGCAREMENLSKGCIPKNIDYLVV